MMQTFGLFLQADCSRSTNLEKKCMKSSYKSSTYCWPASAALFALVLNPALAQANPQSSLQRPLIPLLKADQITPLCTRTLTSLRRQMSATEHQPAARANDTKRVMADWNNLQIAIEDVQGPVDILNNVSPDAKVRSATEACLIELNKFSTELLQN